GDLAHCVVEHPADHRRVVAGRSGDHEEEEPADVSTVGQPAALECADRSAACMATKRELGHQCRHANDHRYECVEEHERRAAKLSNHVWKAPDVAKPYRYPDDRHEPAEAGRESFAGFGHAVRTTSASTSSARSTSSVVE